MFSIQEICDKYKDNLREVRASMDRKAEFHPDDASVYKGLNWVEKQNIKETLRAIPYRELKEYLSRGTTIGDYLVADKIHDDLIAYSADADICPLISAHMVEGWAGGDLLVDIPSRTGYVAEEFVSGGIAPTSTVEVMKATLSPVSFGVPMSIANDLVEDTSFNGSLIEWHIKRAAQAIGEKASNMAVTVLGTAADGWGTLNSGNAGADTTTWANIETAIAANTDDHWISNTILANPEAFEDSFGHDIGIQVAAANFWQPYAGFAGNITNTPPAAGFDFKIGKLDVKLYICDYNHAAYPTDTTAMTNCKTIVFDRNNAILTGRKRWMQLSNYADPVKDLAGAVVSCRQDSVSLYDDCVYTLTET